MTLLIHLGYLTWHREDGRARIPNEEVRTEFRKILKNFRQGKGLRMWCTCRNQNHCSRAGRRTEME